jgi:hypothetical protein
MSTEGEIEATPRRSIGIGDYGFRIALAEPVIGRALRVTRWLVCPGRQKRIVLVFWHGAGHDEPISNKTGYPTTYVGQESGWTCPVSALVFHPTG